jgi:ceramide glucosyltransferase
MEIALSLTITALSIGLFGVACTALAQAFTHRKLLRSAPCRAGAELAPISVLKPLKGVDDALYENLASFAVQDHPSFELLLGVEDPRDPALPIARRLQRNFPHVPIRIVVRSGGPALNPKVSNLLNLFEVASFDQVLISDSNVSVDAGYLRVLAGELDALGPGLVSSPFIGCGERSFGSSLENVQLGTFVIAGVCLGDALGHPIVVGKSMLLRRLELARIGGLEAMSDVLAEDYVLGRRYYEAGMGVALSSRPVHTVNRSWTIGHVWARHLRWAQLRRWGEPKLFLFEAALYPAPWLLTALVLGSISGSERAAQLAATGLALKVAADCALLTHVRARCPRPITLALIPLRDCMLLAAWCLALVRRTVVWRGHRRRIGHGTRLVPIHHSVHSGHAARRPAHDTRASEPGHREPTAPRTPALPNAR